VAVLTVTEYKDMLSIPNNPAQIPLEPALAEQSLSVTGGSVVSTAFNPQTRYVRLNMDSSGACSVSFGTAPTAITGFGRLSPNQTEYRGIPEGRAFKVAVIGMAT
jgi:hypothetical protein